VIRAGSGASRV